MKACILSVSGPVLTRGEAELFARTQPWAVILMGRSCQSRDQVQKLVDDIWQSLGRACLIFIDQEGGRVARLKAPEWPVFPRASLYGDIYQKDKEAGLNTCYLGHFLMGAELSALGIHADCSPVVDLTIPGAHDIIGDRAFGATPEQIGQLTGQALLGLSDAGVAGVIKHIPGHGRAKADSHEELPVITEQGNELAADFDAFSFVKHAPMAMTAHILYPAIDDAEPATTSSKLINDVIRGRIGFDGLLMSDDLGMKALGGTLASRAGRALEAGCDVVLHCSGFVTDPEQILAEMTEVADASAELSGVALDRAIVADHSSTSAKDIDVQASRSEYRAILSKYGDEVYG